MRNETLVTVGGALLLVACCAGPLLLAGGGASLALALGRAPLPIVVAPPAVLALVAAIVVFRHRHRKTRA